jgi:prepilin-type N-terminal cleavage/methylation domain-containing protein
MSQRRLSINGRSCVSGFTLVEVVVSMAVLTIGLVGVAAFVSGMLANGTQARYMNMANMLASEKLDNLNKWPSSDPNVCDSTACADTTNSTYCNGTSCGTITGAATCASGDPYCDQVVVSEAGGADYETQTQVIQDPVSGTTKNQTTTIVHTSAGCVDTPTNCGVSSPGGGGTTFTRRWLITSNPTITSTSGTTATVTGARRITVLVTLNGQATRSPVTFQMSMVRP